VERGKWKEEREKRREKRGERKEERKVIPGTENIKSHPEIPGPNPNILNQRITIQRINFFSSAPDSVP